MNNQDTIVFQLAHKIYTEYSDPKKAAEYLFKLYNQDGDRMFQISGKLGDALANFNMAYSLTVAETLDKMFQEQENKDFGSEDERGNY